MSNLVHLPLCTALRICRAIPNFIWVLSLVLSQASAVTAKTIPIQPLAQNLSSWCWLAVGEMVFRYYNVPNVNPVGIYQCGIAAAVFGGSCRMDCRLCNVGSGPVQTLRNMIVYYPQFVRDVARLASSNLSADVV